MKCIRIGIIEWSDEEYENGLVHVDWVHHRAYWKSEDTKEVSTGRSYSGVGDFRKEMTSAIGTNFCMPCEGQVFAEECGKNYQLLKKAWPKWNEKYLDGAGASNLDKVMEGDGDTIPDKEWEAEFFLQLSKCFWLGDIRTTEIVLGGFLIFVNAISSYWDFAGNAESHKSSAAGFHKIARNIQIEVVRDPEMRQPFPTFVEKVSLEYEYILDDAPAVFSCCKKNEEKSDMKRIVSTTDAYGIGKSVPFSPSNEDPRIKMITAKLKRNKSVSSQRSDDSLIAQVNETMREHSDRSNSEKSKSTEQDNNHVEIDFDQ